MLLEFFPFVAVFWMACVLMCGFVVLCVLLSL